MGKHEKKDPQPGDGHGPNQPPPPDSGRPGKHRRRDPSDAPVRHRSLDADCSNSGPSPQSGSGLRGYEDGSERRGREVVSRGAEC